MADVACYCGLYGICDLKDKVLDPYADPKDGKKGCDIDRCGERWTHPPDDDKPGEWPKGYPRTGWHGEIRTQEELDAIRSRGMADVGKKKNV